MENKEEIKSYGLELPLSTYLAERLIKEGVGNLEDVLSEEDLEEALCKF